MEETMLDHISIGVRDSNVSKRFYDAALRPLGYTCLSQSPGSLGYGARTAQLWVQDANRPVPADKESGLHFCFADNGPPGLRAAYGDNYYAAFVIDPDGYRLEAYCGKAD
jgi:catechol 2,3-dioxygenase-like lactoylglutathione lyase family enzyme